MTISESLPIQFWITGRQTFNEYNDGGMSLKDCFCQLLECDDEVTIQFSTTTDTGIDYRLIVGLEDETDIANLAFTHEEINPVKHIYTVTFRMSDIESPCTEQQVYFRISSFT